MQTDQPTRAGNSGRLTVLFQDVGYRTLSREVVAEQGLLELVEE